MVKFFAAIGQLSRRLKRSRDGVAAVEFALVFPLLLTAFFGVIEVGRLVYVQAALNFAAQEATRFAVVREGQLTTDQIEAYAASQLIGVDKAPTVFTVTAPLDPETASSLITVEVRYTHTFLLPLLPVEGIEMTASSRGFLAFQN